MQNKHLKFIIFTGSMMCLLLASAQVSAERNSATPVEVTASFWPSTISAGESSQFRWSSVGNVGFCFVQGVPGVTGRQPAHGNVTVSPSSNLSATVSCSGSTAGSRDGDTDTATLTVQNTAASENAITDDTRSGGSSIFVEADFDPTFINVGEPTVFSWNSNGFQCRINGVPGLNGTQASSGSLTLTPDNSLNANVACTGSNNGVLELADDDAFVFVSNSSSTAPSITARINSESLLWFSTNATACDSGALSGSTKISRSKSSQWATISCIGTGGVSFATAFANSPDLLPSQLLLDLNNDGVSDQITLNIERQQLIINLADNKVKTLNNIISLSQIQQILIQEDNAGHVNLEITTRQ